MNAPYLRVEDPYRYVPGGYHPVHIDDLLHNARYRILHKLGHGSFSTVWLALNQHAGRADAPAARYVAVKIHTADAPSPDRHARILRHLRSPPPRSTSWWSRLASVLWAKPPEEVPDASFLPLLLDEFDLTGPAGSHRCHVTPVVGPSVVALKYEMLLDPLPLPLARRACLQLAHAVAYLHSRGVAHGGNIAIGRPAFDQWSVDEVYERLGVPQRIPVPLDEDEDGNELEGVGKDVTSVHADNGNSDDSEDPPLAPPRYAVPPVPADRLWALCGANPSVTVIDFGEAWMNHPLPPGRGNPDTLTTVSPPNPLPPGRSLPGPPTTVSPPEILIARSPADVSATSDIWTLACTLYELFADRPFFHLVWGDANEVIADIVAQLGILPERWWRLWRGRKGWYDEDGEPRDERGRKLRKETLERRVETARGGEVVDARDVEVLKRVLEMALRAEPAERATAGEIVEVVKTVWGDEM